MGVWEDGGMGEKNEDGGSKIEWVSIRLAILDARSSILDPQAISHTPNLPYSHTE